MWKQANHLVAWVLDHRSTVSKNVPSFAYSWSDLWVMFEKMYSASGMLHFHEHGHHRSCSNLEKYPNLQLVHNVEERRNKCFSFVLPFKIAVAHNCRWTSGILEANCIAGVTIFMDSVCWPCDKNMWPRSTRLHDVSRFRSSEFAIFNVSRRCLLMRINNNYELCRISFWITLIMEKSNNYLASLYRPPKNAWRPCT